MQTLPPSPASPLSPSPATISAPAPASLAPGDIYPRSDRERGLCATASHTDWLYLGALVALDVGSIAFASNGTVKYDDSVVLRYGAPVAVGLTWGATVGGAWLAMPKCSLSWVGEDPREGGVRETWPLALAFALLAGATAPVVNGIAIGSTLPQSWTNEEREAHVVAAGLAGFVGALVPYLLPPRTWSAARELERLRLGVGVAPGAPPSGYLSYRFAF